MKKIIISLLLMAAPVALFAQFKVKSNGRVYVGPDSNYFLSSGLYSKKVSTGGYNCGLYGESDNTNHEGFSYGVYGIGKNGGTCANFGIFGALGENCSGAGIFGTSDNASAIFFLNGTYAGLFYGDTKVMGTLTANIVVQQSDLRLKENIKPLSSLRNTTLDNVLNLNVVEYNYKKMIPSLTLPDSVNVENVMKTAGIDPNKKHIGLIAQELQELYPELVVEGQDGYLAVNYMELVPILIQAIQELNKKVEMLEGVAKRGNSMSRAISTGIERENLFGNVLYHNTPNPFKEQTTIRFSLAKDAHDAAICIFDMTGKMLKKLPISSGETSVSINGWELGEGMFLYTLMVNGREIDTKRMIITK